ncbi:hypothetical protein MJM04_32490, partial [Salmonella enterica subsp. enterica serovar Cerro]|nr:hypothetical protein [Salmonella enterica subsp. enterica serovar Cerro]
YGELALAQRVLRDFADAQLDRIRVDSRLTYESLLEFTAEYIPALVDMRFVKPLDDTLILEMAAQHDALVTLEENAIMGGAGSGV